MKNKIKLSVILIIVSVSVKSQGRFNRYYTNISGQKAIALIPQKVLFFETEKKDTIFLSVEIDSLGIGIYSVILNAIFPKSINAKNKNIYILFTNGDYVEYKFKSYYDENNFIEYMVSSTIQFDALTNNKCKSILFYGIGTFTFTKEQENYFIDILKTQQL